MFCNKCGKEMDNDSVFCKYCGVKLDNAVVRNYNEEGTDNSSFVLMKTKEVFWFTLIVIGIFLMMIGGWLETFMTEGGDWYYEDRFSLWGFKSALERMDSWGIEIQEAVNENELDFARIGLKAFPVIAAIGGIGFLVRWMHTSDKTALIYAAEACTVLGFLNSLAMLFTLLAFNGYTENWGIIELTTIGIWVMFAPAISAFGINKYKGCTLQDMDEQEELKKQ